MKYQRHDSFTMSRPCKHFDRLTGSECGCLLGNLEPRGGQNCVYCCECGKFVYNMPKTESGEEKRSVTTVHAALRPKVRAAVIARSGGQCEWCGKGPPETILHAGHIISVKAGIEMGMTDLELNDEENLMALCEECNLGSGDLPMPLRMVLRILRARIKFREMATAGN